MVVSWAVIVSFLCIKIEVYLHINKNLSMFALYEFYFGVHKLRKTLVGIPLVGFLHTTYLHRIYSYKKICLIRVNPMQCSGCNAVRQYFWNIFHKATTILFEH